MSCESSSSSKSLRRRLIGAFTAFSAVIVFFLVIGIHTGISADASMENKNDKRRSTHLLSVLSHRKLLNHAMAPQEGHGNGNATMVDEPNRVWSDNCSKSDIMVSQGDSDPMPNGIPTYTVEIMNLALSGGDISGIHVSCGWFSSVRIVNPRVFRRIRFDDCLVNDGKPLPYGATLSFEYANSFRYPLTVSSVAC